MNETNSELNWSRYEEIKSGDRESSEIIEIVEGKLGDFKSVNYFKNNPSMAEESAIRLICENGAKLDIRLPGNYVITPQSNLTKFKRKYAEFPRVGLTVETVVDEQGFIKVILG
tara:strand:+ start:225 stop:566 length:342 start_codon:yes stop_codon:yes gene_type:complete